MPSIDTDTIKLQLAMAFGQGAGLMIATEDALNRLLSGRIGDLIVRVTPSWDAAHWGFIELTRLLGQMSAQRAAARSSFVIEWQDIEPSVPGTFILCPCDPKTPPTKSMF